MEKVKADVIAFDSVASNRTYDEQNKRLVVLNNNLTQDQVAPYLGKEIVDWEEKGLDPERIYYAWRNPEELEKALDSFNGVPLLFKHQMDTGESADRELRVGTVGSKARWEAPHLINDLYIWDEEAIKAIEDGSLRDLSCGYSYVPEWKSGTTPDGLDYDFIMRDIHCNHVALVQDGRAPDCFVSDSLPKDLKMEEEVKVEAVKEAQDDFTEFARKAVEGAGIQLSPEDIDKLVRSIAIAHAEYDKNSAENAEAEVEGTRDEEGAVVDSDEVEVKAEDEEAEAKDEDEAEDECAKDEDQAEDEDVDAEDEDEAEEKKGGAMDANTVAKLVRAQISAQYEAASAVKPFIGSVDPMAFDSAKHIYALAVKKMTRKACALDSAKDVFTAVSAMKKQKTASAMDSASKPSGVMAFLASKLNH